MTRDLLIVSSRALTAGDLSAAVAAIHQGRAWSVSGSGGRLTISNHDQLLIEAGASERLDDWSRLAHLFPDHAERRGPVWSTRLEVIPDDGFELGLDIARAVAWESDGHVGHGRA